MAVSRISALFGTKFFPGFPNQRRPCDSTCGCGYFPTDCSRYGYPGLDLKWDSDWKVTYTIDDHYKNASFIGSEIVNKEESVCVCALHASAHTYACI